MQNTPTIGNMPHADIDVLFPSGETKRVNMIVLLALTQSAEMKAKFGHFLAPNMPKLAELRETYELDWFFDAPVRTWADAAQVLRFLHGQFTDSIRQAREEMAGLN